MSLPRSPEEKVSEPKPATEPAGFAIASINNARTRIQQALEMKANKLRGNRVDTWQDGLSKGELLAIWCCCLPCSIGLTYADHRISKNIRAAADEFKIDNAELIRLLELQQTLETIRKRPEPLNTTTYFSMDAGAFSASYAFFSLSCAERIQIEAVKTYHAIQEAILSQHVKILKPTLARIMTLLAARHEILATAQETPAKSTALVKQARL